MAEKELNRKKTIHGCDVTLKLTFRRTTVKEEFSKRRHNPYNAESFAFDTQFIRDLHSGKFKMWTKDGFDWQFEGMDERTQSKADDTSKYELFYKQKIADRIRKGFYPDISFEDFQQRGMSLLSDQLFYVIEHLLPDIVRNKKHLSIKCYCINRNSSLWLAFEEQEKTKDYEGSTPEEIIFYFSGPFFTGRIYLPWVFLNKVDSAFIIRNLAHECQHAVSFLKGHYPEYHTERNRLIDYMEKNPEQWYGSAVVIYTIFGQMYFEGLANFFEHQNWPTVKLNVEHLQKLRTMIEVISLTQNKEEAESYYDDVFSKSNSTGEYHLGHMMCFIIGLSVWKKLSGRPYRPTNGDHKIVFSQPKNDPKFLSIGMDQTPLQVPGLIPLSFEEATSYILRWREVEIMQLPSMVFQKTYNSLKHIKHFRQFIKRFENACHELHFDGDLKFIDSKFYEKVERNSRKQSP